MRQGIPFLFVLLAIFTNASAKKAFMPIEFVAAQADCIVIGEIVSVESKTNRFSESGSYQFSVTEYIKGTGSKLLTVQQFREWTCDWRYAKAAKGQRLVLFLKKHQAALEIIDGSTGEIPIINGKVTLQHEAYDYQYGKPFVSYTIKLREFKTGIEKFTSCFKIPVDPLSFFPKVAVQLCGAEEITTNSSANDFTGWLYRRIKTRYKMVESKQTG